MSQSAVAQAISHLPGMNGLRKGTASEPGASGEQLPQGATSGPPETDGSTKQLRNTTVSPALSPAHGQVCERSDAGQPSHLVSCNPNQASKQPWALSCLLYITARV